MSYHGRYDPSDFNVPPELEKGKSQRIQCYIQSGHDRALHIIARCGVFPFDREADVIRWSLKLGLEKLDTLEPQLINSVMRRANMMIAVTVEDIERQKFLEAFALLRQSTSGHMGRNDEAMAREIVARWRKQIHLMPDEPERELRWKQKYLNELENNFKHLIDEDKVAA